MSRTVLITGAAGGIGRALVKKYAELGFNIIAHMRKEKVDFLTFSRDIESKYNIDIREIYFDLENEDDIKRGLQELVKSKVKIDILINNAGVEHGGMFQMTPIKDVKKIFNINYFAVVQVTQTIARVMAKNGGGTIVNIASVAGIDLEAGNVAYGASKAALIAFTKSVSKELASQNIRINAIAPGLTDTRMAQKMEEKAGKEMVSKSSFRRLARPEEIVDAIVFLTSDNASFITGQTLRVDGGM